MTDMLYIYLNLPLHTHINCFVAQMMRLRTQMCQFNGYVKRPVGDELNLLKNMHKIYK